MNNIVAKALLPVFTFGIFACDKTTAQEKPKGEPVLNTPGTPAVVRSGVFGLAVIPDTQYYTAQYQKGGSFNMFKAQTDWIQQNQQKENIAYVAHMGDITEHGDDPVTKESEWFLAKTAMYKLESPISIPYGCAIGNHDQFPHQYAVTGKTEGYNRYFGFKHFEGRPYYGGHYADNNDSHYDLFTAGGVNFVVVFLEFDHFNEDLTNRLAWANEILKKYADRKAIVVSHSILSNNGSAGSNSIPAGYTPEGGPIYEGLKDNPNVFMMLCGHIGANGEGYRVETYKGHTVKIFLNDYQGLANGGNGLMRMYYFDVAHNTLSIRTFSPYAGLEEIDGDSHFTVPLFDKAV